MGSHPWFLFTRFFILFLSSFGYKGGLLAIFFTLEQPDRAYSM
jgi:hypothetical protein